MRRKTRRDRASGRGISGIAKAVTNAQTMRARGEAKSSSSSSSSRRKFERRVRAREPTSLRRSLAERYTSLRRLVWILKPSHASQPVAGDLYLLSCQQRDRHLPRLCRRRGREGRGGTRSPSDRHASVEDVNVKQGERYDDVIPVKGEKKMGNAAVYLSSSLRTLPSMSFRCARRV